jgi:hypothetical protein
MRRQALLPDMRSLLAAGGFWSSAPARAYVAAGLPPLAPRDAGHGRFQRPLAHGDFSGVYGRSLEELVGEWQRMLDALPLDEGAVNRAFARFREPSLFQRPCVREVADLLAEAKAVSKAQPGLALRLLQRCAALQPEEPDHLLALATLLRRLDRPAEVREVLDRAASLAAGRPSLEAQVALARADLAWADDDTQTAGAALEQARSLHPGPDLERQAEVKRAALGDPRIATDIRAFFDTPSDELRLHFLERARRRAPESAMVSYCSADAC